ncbi:hypothetical protein YGH029_13830 [Helicobacter pylori]
MRGFSFIGGELFLLSQKNKFYNKMTNAPKVKDKPAFHKETPKLFRLRGTLANTLLFYRKDYFKPLKRDFNV